MRQYVIAVSEKQADCSAARGKSMTFQNHSKNLRGILLLTLTALIWGVAFVAQNDGAAYISAYTFIFLRFMIGGTVLLPLIFFRSRKANKNAAAQTDRKEQKASFRLLLIGGIVCGAALFAASTLQQLGFADPGTTSGKAAFITALYILFVPVFGLFLRKKVPFAVWAGVLLAGCGMYLLCLFDSFTLSPGDLFELLCAVCFSIQILAVDYFAPRVDCLKLSCIQFYTAGLLGGIVVLFTGMSGWEDILKGLGALLYVGIMSSGVAYTLQVIGQKYCDPAIAPLVMSLESVFAALAGWALRGEAMKLHELTGCALIFAAILLTQLPWDRIRQKLFLKNRKRKMDAADTVRK